MALPESRQRARELIRQIAKDHGYLGQEKLQALPPETRRDVEEALMRKDEMIGSSVITLAEELYTSKAKFVFELLQNADDNSFSRAAALGESPYISFSVFPNRIIVECNEDGFTDENIKAICAVGKSSKTKSEGYIGEKGIGFKSVFMAAWKAHIQSGLFSFSFNHRNGQSGMGMISPVWEEDYDNLDSPMTRLTLHLHDNGDTDTLRNAQRVINEQFQELQETLLLFMKNLKKIRVAFHSIDEAETSSVVYSIERPGSHLAVLTRTVATQENEQKYVKHYHVTTHQATNVPKHENRTYSNHANNTSQIVLAFPLSDTSSPIVEPQDVFVYLPVRPAGFNFIIQADFVTDASREDIVKDSLRNSALLDGVADAFVTAVLQFCEQYPDGLRFQWMRYLPDRNKGNWGRLWLSLVDKIVTRLRQTSVLYCHKKLDRHLIRDLVRLTSDLYADGEPLFEDTNQEKMVSERYSNSDLEILMKYGLNYACWNDIIQWIAQDLKHGSQSRMQSTATTASWHTNTAKLLHRLFSGNWEHGKTQVKAMPLLPLTGGTWVSATSGPVFFAQVDAIDIPPNIGLLIIDKTINNTHRKTLFQALGVQNAPINLVRKQILGFYYQQSSLKLESDLSLQTSKQHLTFLYLTHHLQLGNEPSHSIISLFDHNGSLCVPSDRPMYMASDRSPYSPWQMLKEAGSASGPGSEAPGFDSHFINEEYFRELPQTPSNQAMTWVEWLHCQLRISKFVYLGHTQLSKAAEYLQRHRPERFLGALRIHHQHTPHLSPQFIACVQSTKVLCRDGGYHRMADTYFPTKRLESLVERFVEYGAPFPWLWLDDEPSYDTIPDIWGSLLRKIDVGIPSNDLDFALAMLQHTVRALQSEFSPGSRRRLFSLYSYIQAQYRVEGGSLEAKADIRKVFADNKAICVPSDDSNAWASPESCVWNAAQKLDTMFALRTHYESLSYLDQDNKRDLEQLFTSTLEIADCSLEAYVSELKSLSYSASEDSGKISTLYKEIDRLSRVKATQEVSRSWLRSQFEDQALIYVASNEAPSWHKTSQCVWITAARLRDMVSLNNEYEGLEEFFVDVLGVGPVTLSMAINELKEAGSRESVSVEEIKASILTVNSLLCSESDSQHPKLLESKIFPVRYPEGGVQCVSAQTQFFIADRESLRLSFEGQVKFLDFSLEEVVQLHPFLSWIRLEDRYVSRCVRELTSVLQDSDTRPIFRYGQEFRHRAHALLRIAKHFESPRVTNTSDTDELYKLLRNAKILAADTIALELSLSQDGVSHKALGESINMHLHEKGSNLTVYLPRKKTAQQHAFNKHLPERLLQWLMTEEDSQIRHETSDKAIIAMKDVWNTPLATLATTLDECGIIEVNIPHLAPVIDESLPDPESDVVSEGTTDDWGGSRTPNTSDNSDSDTLSDIVETPPSATEISHDGITGTYSKRNSGGSFTAQEALGSPSFLFTRSPTPDKAFSTSPPPVTPGDRYLRLLENVIAAAETCTIPNCNERSMDDLRGSVSGPTRKGVPRMDCEPQSERDQRVGAAGELFVFELLSRLNPGLPKFTKKNWESTIRHHVCVHPDYAKMGPWTGDETADITYEDTQGILTDLLIRKNYLDRGRWAGKTPHYFIEVKSTTSACNAPFFMSKAQRNRMSKSSTSGRGKPKIYVIFRVYHLDRSDQGPGLRIYMDPESLSYTGELQFRPQQWSVVPGRNAM